MLIWRLILEQYVPDIEYIKGDKNIAAHALSILTMNGNQETTQYSTYKRDIVSEINDNEELPNGILPINLKLIDQYQWK